MDMPSLLLPLGIELRAVSAPSMSLGQDAAEATLLLPTLTPFCCELRNSCLRAKLPFHTQFVFLFLGAFSLLGEEAEKHAYPISFIYSVP